MMRQCLAGLSENAHLGRGSSAQAVSQTTKKIKVPTKGFSMDMGLSFPEMEQGGSEEGGLFSTYAAMLTFVRN